MHKQKIIFIPQAVQVQKMIVSVIFFEALIFYGVYLQRVLAIPLFLVQLAFFERAPFVSQRANQVWNNAPKTFQILETLRWTVSMITDGASCLATYIWFIKEDADTN